MRRRGCGWPGSTGFVGREPPGAGNGGSRLGLDGTRSNAPPKRAVPSDLYQGASCSENVADGLSRNPPFLGRAFALRGAAPGWQEILKFAAEVGQVDNLPTRAPARLPTCPTSKQTA